MSFAQEAFRSGVIVATGNYAVQAVNVLVQLVLIRLILPSDWGVYALATVASELLYTVLIVEFSTACLFRHEEENIFHTAVALSVAWFILVMSILYLLGPLLAEVMGEQVFNIAIVIVAVRAAYGIGSVYGAYLERELKFGYVTIARSVSRLIALGTGVAFAIKGFGIYALLLIDVTNFLLAMILCMQVSTLSFSMSNCSLKMVPIIFQKGLSQLWFKLSSVSLMRSPVLLAQFLTGNSILVGYIDRAMYLSSLAYSVLTAFVTKILFILFRKLRESNTDISKQYNYVLWITSRLLFPVLLLLILFPEVVIGLVYGDQWLDIVPILRGFGAFSLLIVILNIIYQLFMGIDKLLHVTLVQFIMLIVLWSIAQLGIDFSADLYLLAILYCCVFFVGIVTLNILARKHAVDSNLTGHSVLPLVLVLSVFTIEFFAPNNSNFLILSSIGLFPILFLLDLFFNREFINRTRSSIRLLAR